MNLSLDSRFRGNDNFLFKRHARAPLLAGAVIGPEHARGDAAPRAPALADFFEACGLGAFLQIEREARGFLQGEIAGRPRVGVAEAEQKENVGRPWAYAFYRDEFFVRFLRIHRGERIDVE